VKGLVNLKGFPELAFRMPAPTFQIVPTTLKTRRKSQLSAFAACIEAEWRHF